MMFGGTLDRDIRFSPEEIAYLQPIVRKRIREAGKSIARAEANRAAGNTIQHGTYERHLDEIAALGRISDALEIARKQIAHRVAAQVNAKEVVDW